MDASPAPPLPAGLAPEFRLLCLACGNAGDAELARACGEVDDWEDVWSGCLRHRVIAPLHAALVRMPPGRIPADILERLQRQVVIDALLAQRQSQTLAALLHLFGTAGIPVLVLKGLPLAVSLYGTIAGRGVGDIDLLVAPASLPAADALLRGAGYRRRGGAFVEHGPKAARERVKEVSYAHRTDGMVVELHQRLTENPRLLACDFADLWRRRDMVEVGGAPVPTLPADLLPVYLAIHGACHCWERLRWLSDLADLLRLRGGLGPAEEAARRLGLEAPLRQAVALCHLWLGWPAETPPLARPQALAAFVRRFFSGGRWKADPPPGSLEWLRRHSLWGRLHTLSLRSEARYRMWELTAMLVWPPDWEVIRLPGSLFWLYPVLRPVGWWLRRHRIHSKRENKTRHDY